MKTKKIVTAIASYGMSGRIFHAPFLERHDGFVLKLILERSKILSQARYPRAIIVRDFKEILGDDEVELVIVNTPTCLHYQMCKQALFAGKNVVVEKPFIPTVAEGKELIAIAKDKGLILTVYHNKRLEGHMLTVKHLIEQGRFGKLKLLKLALHRYRPGIGVKKWKEEQNPGAGLLYDIGSHMIDIALQFFGEPVSIKGALQIQRKDGQVVDCFSIDMNYQGFRVNLYSDMLTKERKPSVIIEGSTGGFVKYGHDPQEVNLSSDEIDWDNLGKDLPENYGVFVPAELEAGKESARIKTKDGAYEDFYQNLSKVLRGEGSLLVTAEQALKVVAVIEAVQLSIGR